MRRDPGEVLVGSEKRELVADAKLRKQCIDGADLHAGVAATVTQASGVDMVLTIGG